MRASVRKWASVGLTDGFENIRDHLQDIVESIWDAKKRRQLVFTSHNANLVVNGDAELVVYCDYKVHGEQSAGELKEQGAIDVRGEKAFKLRKEKCGF